jgi:hypothetical protein
LACACADGNPSAYARSIAVRLDFPNQVDDLVYDNYAELESGDAEPTPETCQTLVTDIPDNRVDEFLSKADARMKEVVHPYGKTSHTA